MKKEATCPMRCLHTYHKHEACCWEIDVRVGEITKWGWVWEAVKWEATGEVDVELESHRGWVFTQVDHSEYTTWGNISCT